MTGGLERTRRPFLVLVVVLCLALWASGFTGPSFARAALGGPALSLPASPGALPFAQGERLSYVISWFAIPAGTAVMEVLGEQAEDGRTTFKLVTVAKSNDFISAFYPVENRVESWFDAARLAPRRMVFHRREGKRKNDFDVRFHHEEGTVTSVKDGAAHTIEIASGTQDALSCLYYVRSVPSLVPGTSLWMEVHHDQKNYSLEVRVEGVEQVTGPWGEVEALRVLVVMPFKGIFLNEGNIRVWLTNDARRIPVLMKAKIVIGSVWAQLIEGSPFPPKD